MVLFYLLHISFLLIHLDANRQLWIAPLTTSGMP